MVTAEDICNFIADAPQEPGLDELQERYPSKATDGHNEVKRPVLLQAILYAIREAKKFSAKSDELKGEVAALRIAINEAKTTPTQPTTSTKVCRIHREALKAGFPQVCNNKECPDRHLDFCEEGLCYPIKHKRCTPWSRAEQVPPKPPRAEKDLICSSRWKSRKVGRPLDCSDDNCERIHLEYCRSAGCVPTQSSSCVKWHLTIPAKRPTPPALAEGNGIRMGKQSGSPSNKGEPLTGEQPIGKSKPPQKLIQLIPKINVSVNVIILVLTLSIKSVTDLLQYIKPSVA